MSCENKAYSYHVSVIFDKKECSDDDPVLDRLNDDGKITDIIGNSLRNNLNNLLLDSEIIDFSLDSKKFSPHITLGRVKKMEWRQIEPEDRQDIEQNLNLKFPVNSIEIMESKLKRNGPEYNILESVKLKG